MPSPQPVPKTSASKVRLFRITDIPDVMQQKLGWPMAAKLMRRWFKGAARTMTDREKRGEVDPRMLPAAMLDDVTVPMQWVLGFARVRLGYDRLVAQWNSQAGLNILALRIKTQAALLKGQTSWRFGDLSQPCKVLDKTCQANFVDVGSLNDPLDDFYGAMGKAGLKLAVSGQVTQQKSGKYRIAVDELAVYLRDTYDFNDDWFFSQPLGYWGFSGVQRNIQLRWGIEIDETYVDPGTVPADRVYAVHNDDFQRYRTKYKRGGDFIIFSADAKRIRLPNPLVLEV